MSSRRNGDTSADLSNYKFNSVHLINLEFKFIYTRSNETRKRVGIKMITAFPPPQKKNTGHRNIRCMATMPNT